MARKARRKRTGRRLAGGWKVLLILLLLLAVAAAYAWNRARHWRPDEERYPDQGALLNAADGAVDFDTLDGLGAKFVYIEASDGAGEKDVGFPRNFNAAKAAGLEVGAAHHFDPCEVADGQSANFVTMVPRDASLLPPVILLDRTTRDCPTRVSDAAVQSELTTLVNQIEAHAGKPVILAPSEEFEDAYGISRRIDRNLWLTRSWVEPDYASRPYVMWTANRWYSTQAAQVPLRWVVVRP